MKKVLAERWKALRLVVGNFQAAKSLDATLNVLLAEPFELLSTENAEDPSNWGRITHMKSGGTSRNEKRVLFLIIKKSK